MGLGINKLLNSNLSSRDSPNSPQKRLAGMQTPKCRPKLRCHCVLHLWSYHKRPGTGSCVKHWRQSCFWKAIKSEVYLSASLDFLRHAARSSCIGITVFKSLCYSTGYPIPNPLTCAIIHLLAMASFQWFITIFIIYSRGGKKVSLLSDDRTSFYLIFEI